MSNWELLLIVIGIMVVPTSLIAVYEAWRHPRFFRACFGSVAAAAGIVLYVLMRKAFYTEAPDRPYLTSGDILVDLVVVGLLFAVHTVVVGAMIRSDNVEFATNLSVVQSWFNERAAKFGDEGLPVTEFAERANSLLTLQKWLIKPDEERKKSDTPDNVDKEIVCRLRQLARQGATLEQMVLEVRAKLGFSPDSLGDPLFIMPVQCYFCEAFDLRLSDVETLEKWVRTKEDQLVQELISVIREFGESK